MGNFVEATRELCDDLDSLVEIARQSRAPIRALSLIERARADLQAYLEEIVAPAGVGAMMIASNRARHLRRTFWEIVIPAILRPLHSA